jgi:LacI family transcriptional regulator
MATVSVRDVAAEAGVSVGTVSNVLNRPDRVAEATVQKVTAAVEKLGFVRNDAARQLRVGRSRTIGMVVLDVGNPFFTDVARGAEQAARDHGAVIVLANSDQDASREAAYLDLFEEQRVRGVLITPRGDVDERLRLLQGRGTPAVLVDRVSPASDIDSVSVDDISGGYQAVSHLIQTGRTRIAFIGGPEELSQVTDRFEGARRAVAEHDGVSLEYIPTDALTVLDGRGAADGIVDRNASDRPDAIFAANDLVAVGVLQGLMLMGSVSVPDEIALIGYDDIDFASATVVPLSSMRQPTQLIGRTAIELLIQRSDNGGPPQHVVFAPELVVRDSTRARSETPR